MTPRRRHPLWSLWLAAPLWLLAVLLSMVFSDCSGGSADRVATPRPAAYPRPWLYDTIRRAVPEAAPLLFYANAGATVSRPSGGDGDSRWLNIAYPRYNAVVYCTFTPVTDADRAKVIDNRLERIGLNAGGLPSEVLTLDSPGGFHSQLLVTPAESLTPLQFLSTDGEGWVVSGAVYLDHAPRAAAADSIAPVIDAVRADLLYALERLFVEN